MLYNSERPLTYKIPIKKECYENRLKEHKRATINLIKVTNNIT